MVQMVEDKCWPGYSKSGQDLKTKINKTQKSMEDSYDTIIPQGLLLKSTVTIICAVPLYLSIDNHQTSEHEYWQTSIL